MVSSMRTTQFWTRNKLGVEIREDGNSFVRRSHPTDSTLEKIRPNVELVKCPPPA
ncbi:unnamed protein product, partial [Trichogramma brassicae]